MLFCSLSRWTCVYPIYIDAKRPYGVGKRRIAREKSCWWPHSQLISNAAQMLQLRVLHEPEKCHPRDWENPGRVKILLKEEGRPYNRNITTKKQLLEAIGTMIQKLDTSQTPLPEQITASSPEAPSAAEPKLKQSAKDSSKSTGGTKALATSQKPARPARTRTPKPPSPIPALRDRYMVHSPTIPTGTLVDTVKASIKAQEKAAAESAAASTPGLPGAPGSPGGAGAGAGAGAGKGKRKVIRVRG
ncbi:signal recognition particle, SRP19 subunit [Clavulina sp. PMI_390]|nr:signal recognition particle, SRP19 subunit [Clavulina sp. PMI_390]